MKTMAKRLRQTFATQPPMHAWIQKYKRRLTHAGSTYISSIILHVDQVLRVNFLFSRATSGLQAFPLIVYRDPEIIRQLF